MPDISNLLGSMGIQPESQAQATLGAVTASGIAQGLNASLGSNPRAASAFGNPSSSLTSPTPSSLNPAGTWNPTAYAAAIASGRGHYDPKNKFLFKVQFAFDPDVIKQATAYGFNLSGLSRELTFILKKIDLPKFSFDYEEVNLYNFRTKILKQVKHEELAFEMYDDVGNRGIGAMNAYLQLLVPISRGAWPSSTAFDTNGFAFSDTYGSIDSSMRGTLGSSDESSSKTIISSLIVTQYYLHRQSTGTLSSSLFANVYTFTNPRLVHFEIQDQDYEVGGQANMVTCSFDFDTVNILTGQPSVTLSSVPSLPTGDLLSGASSSGFEGTAAPGVGNQFSSNSATAANQSPANAANWLANKTAGLNPGGGAQAGGATSPFGTASAKTLANVGAGGVAQGIALPTGTVLSDNSTAPSSVADLSSQSSSEVA